MAPPPVRGGAGHARVATSALRSRRRGDGGRRARSQTCAPAAGALKRARSRSYALEWPRTTTSYSLTRPSTSVWGCQMRPKAARSAVLVARSDVSDGSGGAFVLTMFSRRLPRATQDVHASEGGTAEKDLPPAVWRNKRDPLPLPMWRRVLRRRDAPIGAARLCRAPRPLHRGSGDRPGRRGARRA